jgi:hypothetical protein
LMQRKLLRFGLYSSHRHCLSAQRQRVSGTSWSRSSTPSRGCSSW